MKVVIQRCNKAFVTVNKKKIGIIDFGLTIFVGFTEGDNEQTVDYMVNKIINLRIFDDENGIMNKSIIDVCGSVLSVPQFTLYGDASKGNRPSYFKALKGLLAEKLYDQFNNKLQQYIPVEKGLFKSEMLVNLENNGPVTIIIEK
ncbi:MAG: D-tyrosyl-tRNA(Tyr) deacylase [Tenericutes bacterium]|jgi:D-tyrosyl-tRNA(Tyr) deacylase|nr:D-tyrosyl-tRNA(Tyr) deacylase [Mycoplasmatota bacterium]